MNFLQGIGSLAGGLNQSDLFAQYAQNQQDTAAGLGIYAMAGVTPPGQGQGGQQQGMGALMAPPAQQQAQAPQQPPQAPPTRCAPLQSAPPPGGALPQSAPPPGGAPPQPAPPAPQPTPAQLPPKSPPPMPMTAQPGTGVGAGNTPLPTPAQPPGGGTAALAGQQQTQAPPPQPESQMRKDPTARFNNMFDMPQLIGNLLKTPGMTPMKLGRITRSEGFKNMLNQEGLQQYRALNLGLRQETVDIAGQRAGETARHNRASEEYRGKAQAWNKSYKTGQVEITSIRDAARGQRSAVNAQVYAGTMKPDEAKKQLAIIDEEESRKIAEAQKKVGEPPEAPQESGGDTTGANDAASAIEEAKAAIKAGAPRDAVLKRLQENGIDPSGQGL